MDFGTMPTAAPPSVPKGESRRLSADHDRSSSAITYGAGPVAAQRGESIVHTAG
jgi:hypothetical protein